MPGMGWGEGKDAGTRRRGDAGKGLESDLRVSASPCLRVLQGRCLQLETLPGVSHIDRFESPPAAGGARGVAIGVVVFFDRVAYVEGDGEVIALGLGEAHLAGFDPRVE